MDISLFFNLLLVYAYIALGVILGIVLATHREKIQSTAVNILINIITPIQIFITILVADFTLNIYSILQIIGIAIIAHVIQFYTGLAFFKKKNDNLGIVGAQVLNGSFPNSLYFMVPVILLLFPEELLIVPVIYASITLTIKATTLPFQVHSLGTKLESQTAWGILKKILLFPPFAGILFGVIFRFIEPMRTSEFLIDLKSPISQVTSALSAILIGMSLVGLSKTKLKEYWKYIGQMAIVRFGLGFLLYLGFGFILQFPAYQTEVRTILLLIVCAPPAQNNLIYTIYFDFDEKLSAIGIVILTILGLLLLPLFVWFGLSVF